MKVSVGKQVGFCFGVKRAVKLVEKALEEQQGRIYSLGPFIHNPQVVQGLSKKGLKVVNDIHDIEKGTVVIRTHGLHPSLLENARQKGLALIDLTCPYVAKAQRIAAKLKDEDFEVIIFGHKEHPEVRALVGFAEDDAIVVTLDSEVDRLELRKGEVALLAQTTQSIHNYRKLIRKLIEKDFYELRVFNTTCDDVIKRQNSAAELAGRVDVMIILGGKNSANSKSLAEISRLRGTKTYHVETAREIELEWLKGKEKIGIVSGASTPAWIVEKAVEKIKEIK
jgi:4-hydroxy-3-methylbut-2-enyl diphosphate reductase